MLRKVTQNISESRNIIAQGARGRDWKGVEQHIFWGGGEARPEWGRTVLKHGREGEGGRQ